MNKIKANNLYHETSTLVHRDQRPYAAVHRALSYQWQATDRGTEYLSSHIPTLWKYVLYRSFSVRSLLIPSRTSVIKHSWSDARKYRSSSRWRRTKNRMRNTICISHSSLKVKRMLMTMRHELLGNWVWSIMIFRESSMVHSNRHKTMPNESSTKQRWLEEAFTQYLNWVAMWKLFWVNHPQDLSITFKTMVLELKTMGVMLATKQTTKMRRMVERIPLMTMTEKSLIIMGDDNVDDEHKEILDEEYNLLADDLMHLRQNNCQGCWMYDKVNSKRASNFFQVPIGKSTKNMKKQTACWLLTTEKTRLSALPAVTEFYYFVFEHQYLCWNIHRALEIFSYLSRVTWSIINESVMLCLVSEANITRYGISENSHNIHDISVNAVSISCNTVIFNKELRFFR